MLLRSQPVTAVSDDALIVAVGIIFAAPSTCILLHGDTGGVVADDEREDDDIDDDGVAAFGCVAFSGFCCSLVAAISVSK